MPGDPLGIAIRRLLRRVSAPAGTSVSDGELLERFVEQRDQAAIETLLWRHGPMVLRTCRRLLGSHTDAEDCFQATFLVLCRKARAISQRQSVGSWLYKVAYRVCLRARGARLRRPVELPAGVEPVTAEISWPLERFEMRAILDEELNSLPEKQRAPLILHYLENKTVEQVAAELGWAYGTVCSRLTRGKDRLRVRLTKRGVTLSTGAAAALAQEAAAALPPALAQATVLTIVGRTVSVPAAALAHALLRTESLNRLKWVLALVLMLGSAAGAGLVLSRDVPEPNASAAPASVVNPFVGVDRNGDPLPEGAIFRLGSARFRGGANAAVYSPDGRTLITLGRGIRTWDAATGRPLASYYHPDLRSPCALSEDGKFAATQEYSVVVKNPLLGKITLRRLPDLAVHRTLEVPGMGGQLSFCFSKDGKCLAARGSLEFFVWDVLTGRLIDRLPLLNERNNGYLLALSSNGKLLAAQDFSREAIRLWDVDSGQEREPLRIPGKRFISGAFSGNGEVLMAYGTGNEIHLWEPNSGKLIRTFSVGTEAVGPIISFDGKLIATHGRDSSIRLWDATTGKERAVLHGPRQFDFTRTVLAFSPDDNFLVINGGPQIEIWEVATACRVKLTDEPDLNPSSRTACYAALSPDGKMVATSRCATIQLWDAETGRKLGRDLDLGSGLKYVDITFSGDGKFLIGPCGGMYPVEDLLSSEAANPHSFFVPFPPPPHPWLRGQALSHDVSLTRSIAEGNWPIWINDQSLKDLLALSPDRKTVAWGKTGVGPQWRVSLRDSMTGNEVVCVACPSYCSSARFSPDGRSIALLGGGYFKLFDVASGREVHSFEIALPTPHNLGVGVHGPQAFSPDGKLLAAADVNCSIRLWEVASGKELPPLRGHHGRVLSLAFAEDGRRLISGSEDTTALIWDVSKIAKDRAR